MSNEINLNFKKILSSYGEEEMLKALIEIYKKNRPIWSVSAKLESNLDGTKSYFQTYVEGEDYSNFSCSDKFEFGEFMSKYKNKWKLSNSKRVIINEPEEKFAITATDLREIGAMLENRIKVRFESDENNSIILNEDNFLNFFLREYGHRIFNSTLYADPENIIQIPKNLYHLEFRIRNYYKFYQKLPIGSLIFNSNLKNDPTKLNETSILLNIGRKNSYSLKVPKINHYNIEDNINNLEINEDNLKISLAIPSISIISKYTGEDKLKNTLKLDNKTQIDLKKNSIGFEFKSREDLLQMFDANSSMQSLHRTDAKGYFEFKPSLNLNAYINNFKYEDRIREIIKVMKLQNEFAIETTFDTYKPRYSKKIEEVVLEHLKI